MKIFKFGGASIESVDRARNVASILQSYSESPLLVVISAKGKTTNALENVAELFMQEGKAKAYALFLEILQDHIDYATELLETAEHPVFNQLQEFSTALEWVLDEEHPKGYDYFYDQIVSMGELLSTAIIASYLQMQNTQVEWVDVRDIMKTDDNYRDAGILFAKSADLVKERIHHLFKTKKIIITQGYIGSTEENTVTTLGREGSDYSAALFANMLDAESVTIWKDVPCLLNGDPKIFPNTIPIYEITYHEVIEMAYYGAQVIHPKTIKPLQNKGIPLYVKCFLDKDLPGTKIGAANPQASPIQYPPILVLKTNQILLQVTTRDYSFITEDNLSKIYNLFHDCKIKINLIQNAAISFVACIDSKLDRLDELLQNLKEEYDVKRNENLYLFTVRHYTQNILEEELKNRTILLEQKTQKTIQMVVQ
jgi:aspartate kinase